MTILAGLISLLTVIMTAQVMMILKIRQTQKLLQRLSDDLKQQYFMVTDISNHLMGHGDVLNKIKGLLEAEKLETITQQSHQATDSSYKQALKMVEIGASLDDIVSTCSLTRAEVQLLMSLKKFEPQQE